MLVTLMLITLTACGTSEATTKENPDSQDTLSEQASDEVISQPEAEPTQTPEDTIEAALTSGKEYYYGLNGTDADNNKALLEFQKAADLDSPEAYYYIGRINYQNGNYDDAKNAYDKSITLGNSMAKIGLGQLYEEGSGVDTDYDKAKSLYEEAIANGCVEANFGLADLYLAGYGVDPNPTKAIEYGELAIKGSEPEWLLRTYVLLMDAYVGFFDGIDKDVTKVDEYAKKVEEYGQNFDQYYTYYIGMAYVYTEEYSKAKEWFEKEDTDSSLYELGYMYLNGNGVDQDYQKAKEYFEKSADKGYASAMDWLGWLYENGNGVDKDLNKAIEWYEKEGQAGSSYGYAAAGKCYVSQVNPGTDKTTKEELYNKAIENYSKATDMGDDYAMFLMAELYEFALSDYDNACKYYSMVAALGDNNPRLGDGAAYDRIMNMVLSGEISSDRALELADEAEKVLGISE